MLLGVAAVLTARQSFRKKDVVTLIHHAIADLRLCQLGHALGSKTRLFAQFAARHLLRIDIGPLPAPLRQFDVSPAYGVAELLDEVDELALRCLLQRNDDARRVLIDNAVDAALAVRALDDVFANARPLVAIDLAAADGLDGVGAQVCFSVLDCLLSIKMRE